MKLYARLTVFSGGTCARQNGSIFSLVDVMSVAFNTKLCDPKSRLRSY